MKTITTTQLVQLLNGIKGATFVSVVVESAAKLNKKHRETKNPNPFGDITKKSTMFGIIGGSYANAVNNQLEREEKPSDFTPQSHAWAVPVGDSCLMQHEKSGDLYFSMQRRPAANTNKSRYFDAKGNEVSYDDLAGFLPPKKQDSGSQGTDKAVQWLTPKLANVVSAKIGGEEYTVQNKPVTIRDIQNLVAQPVNN